MDQRYPSSGGPGPYSAPGRAILGSNSSGGSGARKQYQLSAEAPVFVPRSMQQPQPQIYHQNQPQYTFEGNAMSQLCQAIQILTSSPASFDDIMKPLVDSLHSAIHEEATLILIVEELFRQSVEESNFRYTGARICNYFSHHLHKDFSGRKFRDLLLKRCQVEHQQKESIASASAPIPEVFIGYTLFMGELLLNMTIGNQPIQVLAFAVCDLLTYLLTLRQDTGLKCVVQVLKLCGSSLERIEKSTDPNQKAPKLDVAFDKIKHLLVDESLTKSIKAMLISVVELRASDWGKIDKAASSSVNGSSQDAYMPNGQPNQNQPIFYDENGIPFNVADTGFVPDEYFDYWAPGEGYLEDYYYGTEVTYSAGDEEFDDEVAAAFEQFMLESNQN